jgi:hypothetical protein
MLALALAVAPPLSAQRGWSGHMGWMGGFAQGSPSSGPLTIDTAAARVREVLTASGYADLTPDEVMEFSNHFYVLVKEKSTGTGAMEVIVERNGFVHPEPGPNMMWNTKYGHMGGGMMGYGQGQAITRERARQVAAQYLAAAFRGAEPDEGTPFYGHFTFDVEQNGKPVGMLSVNAYTERVWYHNWHGAFVQERHL